MHNDKYINVYNRDFKVSIISFHKIMLDVYCTYRYYVHFKVSINNTK